MAEPPLLQLPPPVIRLFVRFVFGPISKSFCPLTRRRVAPGRKMRQGMEPNLVGKRTPLQKYPPPQKKCPCFPGRGYIDIRLYVARQVLVLAVRVGTADITRLSGYPRRGIWWTGKQYERTAESYRCEHLVYETISAASCSSLEQSRRLMLALYEPRDTNATPSARLKRLSELKHLLVGGGAPSGDQPF